MARNEEYLRRFDDRTIERTIRRCLERGVNTVESGASERLCSLLSNLGQNPPLHLVGSNRTDETSALKSHQQKLAFLIENRADIGVIHAQFADRPQVDGSIHGLKSMVDQIHEAGLLAGISTHRVETVERCETENYGIDTYLFPLNLSGFVFPGYSVRETVQDRINIVRGVAKPFVLIKTLAAGRIPPSEGLPLVAENMKSNDLISLGKGSEAEESIALVEKLFA